MLMVRVIGPSLSEMHRLALRLASTLFLFPLVLTMILQFDRLCTGLAETELLHSRAERLEILLQSSTRHAATCAFSHAVKRIEEHCLQYDLRPMGRERSKAKADLGRTVSQSGQRL